MSKGEIITFNPDGSVKEVLQKPTGPTAYFDEKRIALPHQRLPNESKELYDLRLAMRSKILKNITRGRKFIRPSGTPKLGNRATRRRAAFSKKG